MKYSYFKDSDEVSSLIDEKEQFQLKLSDLENQLSQKQFELNAIVNGYNAGTIVYQKFSDLEALFQSLLMPIPDANGNFTAAQQAQITNNNAIEQKYLSSKQRKEALPDEISTLQTQIKSIKEDISKINNLINKKTVKPAVFPKFDNKIIIAVLFFIALFLIIKPKQINN